MTGWLMKAFNVSFYDDRRLCFMEGCTPSMIAFKWDHAVRARGLARVCLRLLSRLAVLYSSSVTACQTVCARSQR